MSFIFFFWQFHLIVDILNRILLVFFFFFSKKKNPRRGAVDWVTPMRPGQPKRKQESTLLQVRGHWNLRPLSCWPKSLRTRPSAALAMLGYITTKF